MNDLYDALENCLQGLAEGQTIESVLGRYPEFEKDLRPMLETALLAKDQRLLTIPADVKRRGRMRLLQQGSVMRRAKKNSPPRVIPMLPRIALVFGLVGILILTSTGFVSASSATLPGDQLYPVKRSWEGLRLFFSFNPEERDLLESQFEQERVDEIGGLLGKKKAAPIQFTGLVTKQLDGRWVVSGIPVSISKSTNSPAGGIPDGAPISVMGITNSDGVVEAQAVQLIQAGGPLPPLGLSDEGDSNQDGSGEDGNGAPPVITTPGSSGSASQNSTQTQKTYQFSGVVQSMQDGKWIINGQTVYTDKAQIMDGIKIGSVVRLNGYFGSEGKFVVTTVEVRTTDNSNKPQPDKQGSGSGGSESGSDGKSGSGGGGDGEGEGP